MTTGRVGPADLPLQQPRAGGAADRQRAGRQPRDAHEAAPRHPRAARGCTDSGARLQHDPLRHPSGYAATLTRAWRDGAPVALPTGARSSRLFRNLSSERRQRTRLAPSARLPARLSQPLSLSIAVEYACPAALSPRSRQQIEKVPAVLRTETHRSETQRILYETPPLNVGCVL